MDVCISLRIGMVDALCALACHPFHEAFQQTANIEARPSNQQKMGSKLCSNWQHVCMANSCGTSCIPVWSWHRIGGTFCRGLEYQCQFGRMVYAVVEV